MAALHGYVLPPYAWEVEFVPDGCKCAVLETGARRAGNCSAEDEHGRGAGDAAYQGPNLEQQQKSEKYPLPNLLALSAIYTPSRQ